MRAAAVAILFVLGLPGLAVAEDEIRTIPFDHFTSGPRTTRRVDVRPGQFFVVDIANLHNEYTVSWEAYPTEKKQAARDNSDDPLTVALSMTGRTLFIQKNGDTRQRIPHEKDVSAYVVQIQGPERVLWKQNEGVNIAKLKDALRDALGLPPAQREEGVKKLLDAFGTTTKVGPSSLVILVGDKQWHTELAGAFVGSSLTDEVWTAKPGDPGATSQVLFRDSHQEDFASLGLATMIHVYKDRSRWPWAMSLGVGITTASDLTLFPGVSVRLGSEAAVTLGAAVGKVHTRPTGIEDGDEVLDVNTLTKLPTRTAFGWFLSVSYSFVGNREKDILDKFMVVKSTDTKGSEPK